MSDAAHTATVGSSRSRLISCCPFIEYPRVFGNKARISADRPFADPADAGTLRRTYPARRPGKSDKPGLPIGHGTEALAWLLA